MKVDVILISYNQEKYIAQALNSILMQRVEDDVQLRVIIADDCSTDSTLDIIKNIDSKQYEMVSDIALTRQQALELHLAKQFVYLQSDHNLGISKNYKRAFEVCDGDYIAILEGDDFWSSPYHIEQHIRFLDSHRECSMSMNKITYLKQERSEFIAPIWDYKEDVRYVDTETQIASGNQLGNLSACVFRGLCIHALPLSLYEMSIADWMLGVMLSQQGLLAILKESTSVYRTNENSQWASLTPDEQRKRMIMLARQYDEYQNGLYRDYWVLFANKLNPIKDSKRKLRDYIPPFFHHLLKSFCPPILKRKLCIKTSK